jgi:hypothetical protein
MRIPKWFLVLWIIGILFPMAFLGRLWSAFGKVFYTTFSPAWTHIVMHTFLYTMLGWLLAQWIPSISKKASLVLIGSGLLIGCLQEGLQLVTAGIWPGWPAEILDLSVDWRV